MLCLCDHKKDRAISVNEDYNYIRLDPYSIYEEISKGDDWQSDTLQSLVCTQNKIQSNLF